MINIICPYTTILAFLSGFKLFLLFLDEHFLDSKILLLCMVSNQERFLIERRLYVCNVVNAIFHFDFSNIHILFTCHMVCIK